MFDDRNVVQFSINLSTYVLLCTNTLNLNREVISLQGNVIRQVSHCSWNGYTVGTLVSLQGHDGPGWSHD